MRIKRSLAERDWEKDNLEREVTSSRNVISVVQKEKEELEKEFANLQMEMSTRPAVASGNTDKESDQVLSAKQEAAHWEESYNFVVQEKEVMQRDLVELQDKLEELQAEGKNFQREILDGNNNCNITEVRPKTRWRDDLDSFVKHWHHVAQNVVQWKSMAKVYVQRRTFNG